MADQADNYFDQYEKPAGAAQAPVPQDQSQDPNPAHRSATPIEVISPQEAEFQRKVGTTSEGKSVPAAQMVDEGPQAKPAPAEEDSYFDQYGKPEELPVKKAAVKAPTKSLGDRVWSFTKGALGQSNRLTQLLAMAGETETSMVQKVTQGMGYTGEDGHNRIADDMAKKYLENVTQPLEEHQRDFDLGPDADFTDKALHGVGSTLMFIDQMIATGGDAAPAEVAATLPGRIAQGLETGASMSQVPAVANALSVGKQVLKQTGNMDAAKTAAITSYTTTIATAGIPMGVGKGLPARLATAAATGPAMGEVQRRIQNAAMPDDMQTPFDLEQSAVEALTSAPFGFLGGHHGEQIPRAPDVPTAQEKPQNIMEHAQSVAAAEVAARGGDMLDQTVAAAHVNAVLGAHHDAAAYEGHIETRNAQAAQEAEIQRQEEAAAAADQAASAKEVPPTPATLFDRREQEMGAQKDADYTAAKNQVGDQAIERGDTLNAGEEKGATGFEKPKLLDSMDPDQLQAFKTLAERRTAEMTQEPAPDESPDSKFTPYVEPKSRKIDVEADNVQNTVLKKGEIAPGFTKVKADEKGPDVMGKVGTEQLDQAELSNSPETEPLVNAPAKTLAERREAAQSEARVGNPEEEPLFNESGKNSTTSEQVVPNLSKPPESLQERRESNGTQAPELHSSEAGSAPAKMQGPDLRGAESSVASENNVSSENESPGKIDSKQLEGNERALPAAEASRLSELRRPGDKNTPAVDQQFRSLSERRRFAAEQGLSIGETEQRAGVSSRERVLGDQEGAEAELPEQRTTDLAGRNYADVGLGGETRAEIRNGESANAPISGEPSTGAGGGGLSENGARAQEIPYTARDEKGQFRKPTLSDRRIENQRRSERQFVAAQKGRDTAPRFAENNASGESSASLEAIRRVAAEKAAGQARHLVDPDGNATPLTGVDSVDAKAPKGHIIAQANGEGGHTILDRGGLSQMHANGLLNRAKERGSLEPEPAAARDTAPRSPREADAQRAKPLTKEEAHRTLKPLLDKVGDSIQVHDDASTLPDHIKADMDLYNHPRPRGVYDPKTDQVHIVAGSHESHDQVMRTAVHEIVGHQGLRHLLGDEYAAKMADIYRTVKGGSWVKDYMSQHGLDARNARHQRLAADEYVAHLAEEQAENPGVLQRAIDAVRSGLRKLGLVRDWTDADIRQLIRKSANNLAAENSGIRESAQARGDGPRFADAEDEVPHADDHPLSQAHKFGKTMEDQANYNPGFVRSRMDWMKDKIGSTIDARMAFIGLRNLPDFMDGKLMPSLRQFIRVHDQMDGRRGDLMNKAADLARDWSQWTSKNKKAGAALGELMHASTLGGVDPSKPFSARYSDAEKTSDATKQAHEDMRKDLHSRLKEVYDKQLDDKGRTLYNTVRDRYAQNRAEVLKALQERIDASGAENNTKKAIMTELRMKFEASKANAPYFPLARFGEHWASAKDKDGNVVSFSRFESASQRKAWITEMKAKGLETDGGNRMDDKSLMERIDPQFVQKITDLVKGVDPKLADEVWQTYLKAMPEMSMRKHFIHRVGRLGYSMDALRAYAHNSFHGAHQLARLEYGNRLDTTLDNIKTEARAVEALDPTAKNAAWASALAREMGRRYDWIKNPRSSPLASALTKFGFAWYLGAAPATAFRVFSQNPMLAQPMLAKFHGQIGATRELSRASAQWAMARGSIGDTLRGDERRAFDTADERGMFSSTATQALASGGSGEPMFTGTYYHVQQALGYLFNAMEHHNRQTTYLAAYRLGKMQGMDHDTAVDHAGDLTWDAHFDYTNANRPRVLQNDFAKVALLFKQYSWGVTYRLAREARDMFNDNLTPEENVMARKAFAGLLVRGIAFGGVTGLPLTWIAESVINAVMGDKDRPFDAKAAAHKSLVDQVGQTAADAIMTGPVGAVSGASLSTGASYNDLWYRPPARDEKPTEQWSDLMGQMLGAIPAIGTNVITGAQMIGDGQTERGLEHFVPPEISALMKAYRYNREGVLNLKGEPVLTRDELDNRDLFLQAIGFTPQKVADAYARNTALKNISEAVQQRRESIINHVVVASGMNDSAEIDSAMEDVDHFNLTNPGLAINGKGLINSMRNRYKDAAESVNGVKLPPGLSELRDKY